MALREALADLGLDPDAGPNIGDLMASSRANEEIKEAMQKHGRVDNVEVQVRGKSGELRTSLLTAQVVFDEAGAAAVRARDLADGRLEIGRARVFGIQLHTGL